MKLTDFISKYYIFIVSLALFLSGIFGIQKVDFWQNDDPYYYRNIQNFLNLNFTLLPETAPTFYSQGLLGFLWSLVFGLQSLPVLTFIISILNFYIFIKVIELKFSFSKITNVLIGLILYTNFLHVYSSIGFMTDNYLLFFILIAIYWFEKYEKLGKSIYLHISNTFSLLAFFVKQNSLVFLFATFCYFLINKRYKQALIQFCYLISISLFYYFVFPQTLEMQDKSFSLNKIVHFDEVFSLSYAILILLSFYTLPLLISSVIKFIKENFNFKALLLFILISTSIYILLNNNFRIGKLSFQEFPYFENVFERTGFFPRTVHGTKYQFRFNYDYFRYSDLISKVLLALFSGLIIFYYKKIINLYSITLFGLFFLMLFVSSFFDRYILFFIPFALIFILKYFSDNFYSKTLLVLFVIYQAYFSYIFSLDFIQVNSYIWNKSQELVSENVSPNNIYSTSAWTDNFGKNSLKVDYIFSYDSPKVNQQLNGNYRLIEEKRVDFKGNLFINPIIYLYKLKVK